MSANVHTDQRLLASTSSMETFWPPRGRSPPDPLVSSFTGNKLRLAAAGWLHSAPGGSGVDLMELHRLARRHAFCSLTGGGEGCWLRVSHDCESAACFFTEVLHFCSGEASQQWGKDLWESDTRLRGYRAAGPKEERAPWLTEQRSTGGKRAADYLFEEQEFISWEWKAWLPQLFNKKRNRPSESVLLDQESL